MEMTSNYNISFLFNFTISSYLLIGDAVMCQKWRWNMKVKHGSCVRKVKMVPNSSNSITSGSAPSFLNRDFTSEEYLTTYKHNSITPTDCRTT